MGYILNQKRAMRNSDNFDEIGSTRDFVNRNLKDDATMEQIRNPWEERGGIEIKGRQIKNINEIKKNEMEDINAGEYQDRRMLDDMEIEENKSIDEEEGQAIKRPSGQIRVETKLL
jgi:hypothetical protein